jgi:hypothetical protein
MEIISSQEYGIRSLIMLQYNQNIFNDFLGN